MKEIKSSKEFEEYKKLSLNGEIKTCTAVSSSDLTKKVFHVHLS